MSAAEVSTTRAATKRLPVAFVAFQSGKHANGGLASLFEIASRLERVLPLLITQRESEYNERWRRAGFEVLVWPLPNAPRDASKILERFARNAELVRRNRRVAQLLRERSIRVVHCNDGSAMAMAAVGARAAGAKLVLNIRDTALGNHAKWRAYRLLADEIIVLSREMRSFVEGALSLPKFLSKHAAPIASIYSIVDTERMTPASPAERAAARARLGMSDAEFSVSVVGAFVAKKQQLDLLEHLARHPFDARLRFYFVGDFEPRTDPYAAQCERVIAAFGLSDRVRVVGFSDEPADYYRASDVTLLPSKTEGLARSTIESLACGTPVVAFDFCSAREVLQERSSGIVLPQGDFAGMLSALANLASDRELLRKLGQNGVATARSLFHARDVAEAYEATYLRLAQAADGRTPLRISRTHRRCVR